MQDPETMKLFELLGHLTAPQLWGICGAAVGVVVAAFSSGMKVAGYKCELKIENLNVQHTHELGALRNEVINTTEQLRASQTQLEKAVDVARENESALAAEKAILALKAKFLDHFLRYALAKEQRSKGLVREKNIFVAFVYRLWETQEDAAVSIGMNPQSAPAGQSSRKGMVGPEVAKPSAGYGSPEREEPVIKTVTFSYDGSVYVIPSEIASEVHLRD